MKTVWRVFAYLKRYPLLGIATLGCAIVGTLMVIVFPAVAKLISMKSSANIGRSD